MLLKVIQTYLIGIYQKKKKFFWRKHIFFIHYLKINKNKIYFILNSFFYVQRNKIRLRIFFFLERQWN
jgi:hypothetical protein